MNNAATANNLEHNDKARLMKLATGASVLVATALIAIKSVAWWQTGSVAMLGSLLDSVLDGVAAGLNLFFVRRALQPASEQYRFGHGKAEPIGGMFQAIIIGASALFLIAECVRRMIEPAMPTNSQLGIVIMIVASVLVGVLVVFQRFVVKRTGSLIVSADALHGLGDVGINVGVIVALLVSTRFDAPFVDPVIGILLAFVLIRGAWEIGSNAIRQLMDVEFSEAERQRIREIALEHPEVASIHDLRTRRAGLSAFIQFHIEMDGSMPLSQAHEIADEVELAVRDAFPDAEVLIHEDPEGAESIPQFLRA
ncbi:MAG: cation diffusion facilitator family transporter [Chromatiales bacterium]|nr:MAG: cation diffusion facilitator family transporter [Chromatiales bacterium]